MYDLTPAEILNCVKQAIREPYAFPGGYPKYVVMAAGEPLSVQAARENWREIVWSTLRNARDGWGVAGVEINWENDSLRCCHTDDLILAAYADESDMLAELRKSLSDAEANGANALAARLRQDIAQISARLQSQGGDVGA